MELVHSVNNKMSTKCEFFTHIATHKTIFTLDLSDELVTWLDAPDDIDDNRIIYMDPSGQGGSTVWCRTLVHGNEEYIVDYVTFGGSLMEDEDGVMIELAK